MRLEVIKYAVKAYPKYWVKYSAYSTRKIAGRAAQLPAKVAAKMKKLDFSAKVKERVKLTRNDLIDMESEYGKLIFGEAPRGHRREFFNLNEREWIWHEEWPNEQGMIQRRTVKYQITKLGVLKIQVGKPNTYIEGEELDNFREAVAKYSEIVVRELYQDQEPATIGV
jgi:hypothetical protein